MTAALIFFIVKVLCPASLPGRASAIDLRSPPLLELLARIRRVFTVRSRIARELIILGSALLTGVVIAPLCIWLVGNRILGPYTHGNNLHAGPMALLGDFFQGLSLGWLSYWIVALGPLVIIVFARLAWELINPRPKRPVKSNPRIEPTVAKDRL
jgi:hypothetical protein